MYDCLMRSLKETYVYVILEHDAEGYPEHNQKFIKIGRSICPEDRKRQFELSSPREFEITDLFGPFQHGKAKLLEKDLHKLCCEYHVKGEWFEHEAVDLIYGAMKVDEIMNIFDKQDIQNELKSKLESEWVLSTIDLEVIDKHNQAHVLDIALHTGEFVFGRITVGSLTRAILDGVDEIQCTSFEGVGRCVEIAVAMQERHCRSRVIRQDSAMDSQNLSMVA